MNLRSFTGGVFETNGYWIETGSDAFLVDAPEGIAGWVREQHLKVDALLLTHLHYDHVLDVAALKRDTGCRVYAHSQPDGDLTLVNFLGGGMGYLPELEAFEVDVLLAGQEKVQLGDLTLGCRHLPGHSPDSLGYLLEGAVSDGVPILFDGDVLMAGSIGRSDFPHGDAPTLMGSLQQGVMTLPDETRVLAGHGPPTTVGQERRSNPFLKEGW